MTEDALHSNMHKSEVYLEYYLVRESVNSGTENLQKNPMIVSLYRWLFYTNLCYDKSIRRSKKSYKNNVLKMPIATDIPYQEENVIPAEETSNPIVITVGFCVVVLALLVEFVPFTLVLLLVSLLVFLVLLVSVLLVVLFVDFNSLLSRK